MAPLPVIANTYRVAFNSQDVPMTSTNVMHFRKAGSSSAALAAAIPAAMVGHEFEAMPTSWHVANLAITPLDGSSPTTHYSNAAVSPWQGHSAGDGVPQVAVIVKMTTLFRGRSYRGKVYLPDVAEGVMANGQLNGAVQVTMQTSWSGFLAALTAAGWAMVVASYEHSFANDVQTVNVEQALATQRRRQTRLR